MKDHSQTILQESHSIMENWWNKMSGGKFHPEQLDSFPEDANRAKDIIDQVLKDDPDNEEAQDAILNWHMAVARLKAGFKDNNKLQLEAVEHMKVIVGQCPDDASFRGMLAECYKNLGKNDLAIESLKKGLEIEPQNDVLLNELKQLEGGGGKGCFIATAVYGSYDAPEVIILREFKDKVLINNRLGSLFVRLYYRLSPSIARIISMYKILCSAVNVLLLKPVIYFLSHMKYER